jgi:hypothetical protein
MTSPEIFLSDAHQYTVRWFGDLQPRPVRSTTNILRKVGLTVRFEDFVPDWILTRALSRGRAVHRAIELWNQGRLDEAHFADANADLLGYLQSWQLLMASGRLQTFLCEYRVANIAPRYAGTFDWLGLFDGRAALLDYATGDPEDASKGLQLCGYSLAAKAWAQQPGQERLKSFLAQHPYVRRVAVRLHRDGQLPIMTEYNDPRDYSRFLIVAQAVNVVDAERPKSVGWDWRTDDDALQLEHAVTR